jgi:hypothetical protein
MIIIKSNTERDIIKIKGESFKKKKKKLEVLPPWFEEPICLEANLGEMLGFSSKICVRMVTFLLDWLPYNTFKH